MSFLPNVPICFSSVVRGLLRQYPVVVAGVLSLLPLFPVAETHLEALAAEGSGAEAERVLIAGGLFLSKEERAEAKRARQAKLKKLLREQMVPVQGGTFRMGCTAEQGECADNEKVQVSDFEIGKYEVTRAVWEAVMGKNSSYFEDCPQCAVEGVSWWDVQEFLEELNARLDEEYRLPTVAEWEYAARGGRKSQGYRYAGSDNPDAVAWHGENRERMSHPVGEKRPNELGLYDMSGNVWEWTQDCRGFGFRLDGRAQEIGDCSFRISRGGSLNSDLRELDFDGSWVEVEAGRHKVDTLGFRLARFPVVETNLEALAAEASGAETERVRQVTLNRLETFQMVHVQGGTFRMGCTAEQAIVKAEGDQGYCPYSERPVHEVQVSDFEIGKYEVTRAVWAAVMGENPSRFGGYLRVPVESVSWEDVQEFLKKLNARLDEEYRLPTEAEWEYAARGGRKSEGYRYAGSHAPDAVAWYDANSGGRPHLVGEKRPNELGLYDMSGNVSEWVADCWHGSYKGAPSDGGAWESRGYCSWRVQRGGSWRFDPGDLCSANRGRLPAGDRNSIVGFRLARTLTP